MCPRVVCNCPRPCARHATPPLSLPASLRMPGELPAASPVIPCGATQRRIPRASRVLPVAYDGDFLSDPFQLMTAPVALLCNSRWRDSANTRRSLITGNSACHRALQQIFNNPTGPANNAALEPAAQLQQRRGCKRYQARLENTPPKRAENRPHNRCRRDHADTCASALPTRPDVDRLSKNDATVRAATRVRSAACKRWRCCKARTTTAQSLQSIAPLWPCSTVRAVRKKRAAMRATAAVLAPSGQAPACCRHVPHPAVHGLGPGARAVLSA